MGTDSEEKDLDSEKTPPRAPSDTYAVYAHACRELVKHLERLRNEATRAEREAVTASLKALRVRFESWPTNRPTPDERKEAIDEVLVLYEQVRSLDEPD